MFAFRFNTRVWHHETDLINA